MYAEFAAIWGPLGVGGSKHVMHVKTGDTLQSLVHLS